MSRGTAVAGCVALYSAWMAATFLLEGYPQSLLRPEATALRAAYAVVANLAIGVAVGFWTGR